VRNPALRPDRADARTTDPSKTNRHKQTQAGEVGGAEEASTSPAPLTTPINIRSTSMALVAFMALVVFLRWAQAVFIPIALAVFLSYALTPVVDWLKRYAKLHKAIGQGGQPQCGYSFCCATRMGMVMGYLGSTPWRANRYGDQGSL
jgi:hypothetical protein